MAAFESNTFHHFCLVLPILVADVLALVIYEFFTFCQDYTSGI